MRSTKSTGLDMLWSQRYELNAAMLPTFVSPALARRILLAGKAIVFMRAHGGAVEELPGRAQLRRGAVCLAHCIILSSIHVKPC